MRDDSIWVEHRNKKRYIEKRVGNIISCYSHHPSPKPEYPSMERDIQFTGEEWSKELTSQQTPPPAHTSTRLTSVAWGSWPTLAPGQLPCPRFLVGSNKPRLPVHSTTGKTPHKPRLQATSCKSRLLALPSIRLTLMDPGYQPASAPRPAFTDLDPK